MLQNHSSISRPLEPFIWWVYPPPPPRANMQSNNNMQSKTRYTVPCPTWKENHGLSLQVQCLPIDIVVNSNQLLIVATCTAGYGCVSECPETNNVWISCQYFSIII